MHGSFFLMTLGFSELKSSITFELWDTAGQKKYMSLNRMFFIDAKVFILVYDITRKDSFESIKNYWYEEVKNNCKNNPILAVVANKCELFEEEEVNEEEAFEFAKKIGAIFQRVSVAKSWGINELFYNIGITYLTGNINKEEKSINKEKTNRRIKLDIKKEKNFNKKNCIII